jgi:hypothetical protein
MSAVPVACSAWPASSRRIAAVDRYSAMASMDAAIVFAVL